MPKQATMPDDDKDVKVHVANSNSINEEALNGYVAEYEDEDAKIEEIMLNARKACQPHVDQKKAILKEAAEHGIDKVPFKAKLGERKDNRKAERRRSALNEKQQADFDAITAALGEMPLFKNLVN